MKKTKLILATLIMLAAILLNTVEVQAALQANSSTHYNSNNQKKATEWMSGFRQMENSGGGMGLSETLGSDLTSSSGSNSIDVHMMRSTEYGAIAILSASGYGNPSNNKTLTTTTGNKTGIYFSGSNWEFVAGGLENSIFNGKNKKYYDTYTTASSSAKVGDALGETTNNGCQGWHSASYSNWVTSSYPYFERGSGGLFSFNLDSANFTYWGRGVAVVGAGLLYRTKYIYLYFKSEGKILRNFSSIFYI